MPKIALFQDYLAQNGGAERVTEAIHQTLPEADLFTTLAVPERISPYLQGLGPKTTWMQTLPAKSKLFRHYFLFYPFAVESTRLDGYDLVVSSCCGYAKGVKRGGNAIHVCYCHNPMRWVWSNRTGRPMCALPAFVFTTPTPAMRRSLRTSRSFSPPANRL